MAQTYFIDDEPALVERLDAFLAKLRTSLEQAPFASELVVLLLGGGYGRGEGGVYRGPEVAGALLYNDLEFYVVTRGLRGPKELKAWCHHWEKAGHEEIGIEVEFKILAAAALQQAQPSMFYYDLLLGHKVVWGDDGFCEGLAASLRDARLIPLVEVTRLLFNRGSGLLFSRERLRTSDSEIDSSFIERNHAKAKLALGDAVLALNERYDWSCQNRATRLGEALPLVPPDWEALKKWHVEGVAFKLHPRHEFPGKVALLERQSELTQAWLRTFLWLESIRLKRTLPDPLAYVSEPARLFPDTPLLKNLALRVRDQLRTGSRLPAPFDYPRAALQRALVLLLGSQESDRASWQKASVLVGLHPTSDSTQVMQAYRNWWNRYN